MTSSNPMSWTSQILPLQATYVGAALYVSSTPNRFIQCVKQQWKRRLTHAGGSPNGIRSAKHDSGGGVSEHVGAGAPQQPVTFGPGARLTNATAGRSSIFGSVQGEQYLKRQARLGLIFAAVDCWRFEGHSNARTDRPSNAIATPGPTGKKHPLGRGTAGSGGSAARRSATCVRPLGTIPVTPRGAAAIRPRRTAPPPARDSSDYPRGTPRRRRDPPPSPPPASGRPRTSPEF
mmetsp:Transcript_15780/g.47408  ORF Transcript_15780/g.47408 Transcript_15780/m.47408 type:complete len:233 (-) Transcript_15780:375-1073(-)